MNSPIRPSNRTPARLAVTSRLAPKYADSDANRVKNNKIAHACNADASARLPVNPQTCTEKELSNGEAERKLISGRQCSELWVLGVVRRG